VSSQSAIEWCDATWNVVTGCDRMSPGCAHCYALELAPRLRAMGVRKYVEARGGSRASGPAFGVTLHPGELDRPRRWRPRRIFVNSMGDLFHEEVPFEFIDRVFETMAACPQQATGDRGGAARSPAETGCLWRARAGALS
jgi:protein gp37